MRRCAALAVAGLLALLLVAAACKPSSLTPFTGWRQEETETSGVNGRWGGPTISAEGRGGNIDFTIASNQIADFTLIHSPESCGHTFFSVDTTVPLDGDTFELDLTLETQGRIVVNGTFTSSTEASGTYHFEGIRVTGSCPTSSSGSFNATKTQ